MVGSIQSAGGANSIPPSESPQERQKIFELEWEINLISTYVAVSNKSGDTEHQLNKIKSDLNAGKPPEQIASQINQLLDHQINTGISSDVAPFPSFDFASEGDASRQAAAMANHAISLQKYLNVAAQMKQLDWDNEEPLFNDTQSLIDRIGTISLPDAIDGLNQIISSANKSLPFQFQLRTLKVVS